MSEHRHIGPLFSAEDEACLTHVQMKDYASGKISPAEKHHVERHLLNCELCALAFEGLADEAPEAVAEGVNAIVAEAWSRVGGLEQKRRRSAYVWMSSAAVILILILVGFFVIDQQQDQKLDQLADSMFELPDAPNKELEAGAIASADVPDDSNDGLSQPLEENRKGDNELLNDNAQPQILAEDAPVEEEMDFAMAEEPAEIVAIEEVYEDDLEAVEEIVADEYLELSKDVAAPPKLNSPPVATGIATDREQFKKLDEADAVTSTMSGVTEKANTKDQRYDNQFDTGTVADSASFDPGFYAGGDISAYDLDGNDDLAFDMEEEEANEYLPFQQEDGDKIVPTEGISTNRSAPNSISVEQNGNGGNYGNTIPNVEAQEYIVLDQKQENKRREGWAKNLDVAGGISANRPSKSKTRAAKTESEERSNETDYFRRGLEAYENRDFSKGARDLRQAASNTPSNLQAHFYAALCFMEMDQLTAALFHLDRIISEPSNSLSEEAKWYKSIALLRMGKKKQAEIVLKEIREAGGKRKADADKALEAF